VVTLECSKYLKAVTNLRDLRTGNSKKNINEGKVKYICNYQ